MKTKNILICLLLGISTMVPPYASAMEEPNPSKILEITKRNTKALFRAIKNGDKQEVERFLKERYIDINAHEENFAGDTPLICAASKSYQQEDLYQEIVKMLLNAGANVNEKNIGSEDTALMGAAILYNVEIVTILLQNHANPNMPNRQKETPLMWAARRSCPSIKMLKMLLEFGADPNIQAKDGKTALDHAQFYENQEVIGLLISAQEKTAKMFRKIDPVIILFLREWRNEGSPLHVLPLELIEKILIYVKQIRNGESLLNAVKYGNNPEVERLLKERNIDINLKDENSNTALNLGIIQNKPHLLSLVKMLLEAGADQNIQNNYGQTALDLANEFNNYRIKNLLEGEEDSCAICLVPMDDNENEGFALPCGHNTFHSACIEQWKASGSGKTCPFCRGPLTNEPSSWNPYQLYRHSFNTARELVGWQ